MKNEKNIIILNIILNDELDYKSNVFNSKKNLLM